MHFFMMKQLRREKSVSRISFSMYKVGAKLEKVAELQYMGYSGHVPALFTQKRLQSTVEG